MNHIIELLTTFIISVIQTSGYGGVFLLMTLESALIPIPSEVTMTFAGYLASVGTFNILLVALVGAVANLVGSLLAYALGYWGGETVVRRVIQKYGKYVLISEHEYDNSEKWFRKYGEKIVFIARILPVLRTFISLPAGIARMNIWKFIIFTIVGSLIWTTALAYTGLMLGKNWHSLEGIFRKFNIVIAILLVAAVVYYVWHKVSKMKKK